mgnify:CR=1 FL=1
MKLSFFGADQCVTGSCHCLEANGKKILIDCGLQQGRDEVDNGSLPFHAGEIDYVLVTHAHIDHTGRIPMLIKQGFQGRILTTRLTAQLMDIMLQDSAHIQESDAEYQNRKNLRAGRPVVEPLYTVEDALRVKEFLTTCEYGEKVDLCEGVSVECIDAGHLLGSASMKLTVTEGGEMRTIVFSGDIGNVDQPIIRDPQFFHQADFVVMESTYGNRNHTEVWSYTDELAQIIDETLGKGGNVVIPSFAVGRTQELLYLIRQIKDEKLVKSVPDFNVYVDSPLSKAATTIFCGDLRGYLDEEALALVKDGTHMFSFPGLHLTETVDESKNLNLDPSPKVIISASGMCDAGRIRHHLKHNLWRPESAVVFVGFQSPGTLGRHLLDGAESVKMFGEEIAVRAKIVNFQGLSSHASAELDRSVYPRQAHPCLRGARRPRGGPRLCAGYCRPGLFCPCAPVYRGLRPAGKPHRAAGLSAGAEEEGLRGRAPHLLCLQASGGAGRRAGRAHPPQSGAGQQDAGRLCREPAQNSGKIQILMLHTAQQATVSPWLCCRKERFYDASAENPSVSRRDPRLLQRGAGHCPHRRAGGVRAQRHSGRGVRHLSDESAEKRRLRQGRGLAAGVAPPRGAGLPPPPPAAAAAASTATWTMPRS